MIGTVLASIGALVAGAILVIHRKLKNIHFTYSPFWFSVGCSI
jgi:hypothetical protein